MNKGVKRYNQKLSPTPYGLAGIINRKTKYPKGEIFYSVQDGAWEDVNTWETVSGRSGKIPSQYDDVFVKHDVIVKSFTNSVNNLFISGKLSFSVANSKFYVNGNIKCSGTLFFSDSFIVYFYIYGSENYILNFITGHSCIVYCSLINPQEILNIPYYNLFLDNESEKILTADLVVYNQLRPSDIYLTKNDYGYLNLKNFNITINGNALIYAITTKEHFNGNLIFGGSVSFRANNHFSAHPDDYAATFNSNSNIEFHNGLNLTGYRELYTGTGIFLFSVNNQDLYHYTNYSIGTSSLFCSILIDNIILKFTTSVTYNNRQTIILNNQINGTGISSVFKIDLKNIFIYRYETEPMQMGSIDATSVGCSFVYDLAGNQEIKGTTYHILEFGGSGVKKLMGNVIVDVTSGGSWSITGTATINYNGFTITTI